MNKIGLAAPNVGAFPDTKKWLLVTIAPKIKGFLQNVTHLDFLVATQGGRQGNPGRDSRPSPQRLREDDL